MTAATSHVMERQLVVAACAGDEDAFRRLVEPHRPGLRAHSYRMLGSLDDAEDALQEALLRAWRGLCGFDGRSPIRGWLYRIATNVCLDTLARRPKRAFSIDDGQPHCVGTRGRGQPMTATVPLEAVSEETLPLPDGDPGPAARYERREAAELALLAALEHVPARQRAVLILREVLGFSAREVAQALGTSVASVNSALQRARKCLDGRLPEKSQNGARRTLAHERVGDLVQTFVDALERGDIDMIVSLLAHDVTETHQPEAKRGARCDRAERARRQRPVDLLRAA